MALFAKGTTQDDPLALLQAGEFKKAIRLIEAKLKRTPNDPSLRWRLAEAYEGAGRGEEAAAIYREEGEGALASGDRPKAAALFRKALKLLPSDGQLAKRLAGLEEASSQSGVFSFDLEAMQAPLEAPPPSVAPADHSADAVSNEAQVPAAAFVENEPEPAELEPLPVDALSPEGAREASSNEAALLIEAFPGLGPNEVMELMDVFGRKELLAGEVLLHEGDLGEAVYLVTNGRLVARAVIGGETVELAVLVKGDVLGEVAFLNHVPRTATVTAAEPSTLLEMPGQAARERLESLPQVRERLERLIEERVAKTISAVRERLKPRSR